MTTPLAVRVLGWIGGTLGLLVIFLVSLVAGVLMHLDTPRGRSLVMREVNAKLAPVFRGQVQLEALRGIRLDGFRGADATVEDPAGRPIIVVRGVSVHLATLELVRSLLRRAPAPLTVHVYSASIDDANVVLDQDARGHLLVADAFELAHPTAPSPPNPNPRRLRVVVDQFTMAHGRARGVLPSGRSLDVAGALQGQLDQGVEPGAIPDATVKWDGLVGAVATSLRASLNERRVDAVLDVPPFDAAALRQILPSAPLERRGAAHVEVHGPLSDLRARLHLAADETALDGTVSYEGFRTSGVSHGDADLVLRQGKLGKTWIPDATLHATASLRGSALVRALADLSVDEPGAPTSLTLQAMPRGGAHPIVDFELDSSSTDLERVPQLARAVRGSYRLSLAGRIDPDDRSVEGDLHATTQDLEHGIARVDEARVDARVHGAIADPIVSASAWAGGIRAGSIRFDAAEIGAYGRVTRPHVTLATRAQKLPNIEGSVDVALGQGVVLSSLRLALERAGQLATVAASRIELGGARGGVVRVEDARVEGLGQPLLASATVTPAGMRLRATTAGLDLSRIARLAHIETNLGAGTLSLDADVRVDRRRAEGRARLDLESSIIGEVHQVSAHVAGSIEGRRVSIVASAGAREVGTLVVNAPAVQLASSDSRSLAAWRGAWGDVTFDADLDLGRAMLLVPREDLPLGEARGRVVARGHIERDDAGDYTPDVGLSLHTQDLVLAPRMPISRDIDYVWVTPKPPWRLVGVDLDVDAYVDGMTGVTEVTVGAHDRNGTIAELDARTDSAPYDALFRGHRTLGQRLLRTPMEAHLTMPERGLWTLPSSLQNPLLTGRLEADVRASGTALAPHVDAHALLRGSRFQGDVTTLPLDLNVLARYNGERADVSVRGVAKGGAVLDLAALVRAPVAPLLEPDGVPFAWSADAKGHLDGIPLQSIPMLGDKGIAGAMRGDFSLSGLHRDASARADVTLDELRISGVPYRRGELQAKADGHGVEAHLRIDQDDGFLQASAHAAGTWGASLAPTLDPNKPLDGSLDATGFRVAALRPMVQDVLAELDGRLDARVHVELDPRTRSARLLGGLTLEDGRVQAVAGGGEFRNVRAQVDLSPDGAVILRRLTASGVTGRLEATGAAQMRGTSLEAASASILIPDNAPIPLSAGGTQVGDVNGRIDVKETTRGDTMDVAVNVDQARVALPLASKGHVQALGPMRNVRIGAHRGDPATLVTFPLDPERKQTTEGGGPQVLLTVNLNGVRVVRGTDLRVGLGGQVRVDMTSGGAAGPAVTGQLNLRPGGSISVQGKKFTVDHGTVTFVDDPSNPQVVVRASYQAADGTLVYADFIGPLKTGRVSLSSEPPLPRQEIVELLLFGTTGGSQPQASQSTAATQALATVGGEAAQPLNHMLNQLGLGAISTRVASTAAGVVEPEVEVQIARDISVQLAVVLGQPPPGVNPDRTLLTLDWRFASRWSLATTIGDAGTTIFDLLWRKRY
jgi:translocation and assembly module TamB